MKIHYFATAAESKNHIGQESTVVVIDVLRSTSTIISALENGAESIIPVDDVEKAASLAEPSDENRNLLAGEKRGRPVEGFDLFNSPLEFSRDVVRGRTIVLTTSNGTRAINYVSKANKVLICSINNVDAVSKSVMNEGDLTIVCSGAEDMISMEDLFCGGILLESLKDRIVMGDLPDSAMISLLLAESYSKDTEEFLRTCQRGRDLIDQGYEKDVIYCALRGTSRCVPFLKHGRIVR